MVRRILILCEYPSLNGGERSMLSVAGPLSQRGFELVVAAPREGELAEALAESAIPHRVWPENPKGHRVEQMDRRRELKKLLLDVSPVLVHGNSLSTSRLVGPVADDLGIPSVGHLRDIVRLSRRAVGDLNRNRQWVAVSQATRDYHLRQGMDPDRGQVIYNGVDTKQFSPRPRSGRLQRELKIPEGHPVAICIGQIGMRKAIDVVLQVFFELAESHQNLHLAIVGQRHSNKDEAIQYEQSLHRRTDQSAYRDRVHWLGRRPDIARLMNDVDLLIHAARQEPLGRVLLEASAAGLPWVATDAGGTREICSPGIASIALAPVDDAQALAERAGRLLGSPDTARQVAEQNRRQALETFSIRACVDALDRLYHQILDSPA